MTNPSREYTAANGFVVIVTYWPDVIDLAADGTTNDVPHRGSSVALHLK
jgi:hypothetical protein